MFDQPIAFPNFAVFLPLKPNCQVARTKMQKTIEEQFRHALSDPLCALRVRKQESIHHDAPICPKSSLVTSPVSGPPSPFPRPRSAIGYLAAGHRPPSTVRRQPSTFNRQPKGLCSSKKLIQKTNRNKSPSPHICPYYSNAPYKYGSSARKRST